MIVSLEGVLARASQGVVVVEVGGVGMRALVPASTMARLPAVGERVKLHTHLHVREEELSLYGFATLAELELFELLLGVSGLGPAKALAMLSGSSVEALRSYIYSENTAALARVPGIGQRTAARIVLDLKGKIGPSAAAEGGEAGAADGELLAWLTTLGFAPTPAQAVVAKLAKETGLSFEDKARKALELLRPE